MCSCPALGFASCRDKASVNQSRIPLSPGSHCEARLHVLSFAFGARVSQSLSTRRIVNAHHLFTRELVSHKTGQACPRPLRQRLHLIWPRRPHQKQGTIETFARGKPTWGFPKFTSHTMMEPQQQPSSQKLPAGLAGVLNSPDDNRDSAYYSGTDASSKREQLLDFPSPPTFASQHIVPPPIG